MMDNREEKMEMFLMKPSATSVLFYLYRQNLGSVSWTCLTPGSRVWRAAGRVPRAELLLGQVRRHREDGQLEGQVNLVCIPTHLSYLNINVTRTKWYIIVSACYFDKTVRGHEHDTASR